MKHVIIGASAAGIAAAQKIRQLDPHAQIICITQERELPYNKCLLADHLSGSKSLEAVAFISALALEEKNIQILVNTPIVQIDVAAQCISTEAGVNITYDRLLLVTGARAIVPPIASLRPHQSIHMFHTLADVRALDKAIEGRSFLKVAVVGAGLSGLEVADALQVRGHQVTVIEKNDHVLPALLNVQSAACIQKQMRAKQVVLYTSTVVEEIVFEAELDRLKAVRLSNGSLLETDILVIAAGQCPNVELAVQAGLRVDKNGICVDSYLQTSAPGVFSAGDVIGVVDQISGRSVGSCTWPDAMMQGATAAHNMLGLNKYYSGPSIFVNSSFFGLKLSATLHQGDTQHCLGDGLTSYYQIQITDNQVKGFVAIDSLNRQAALLKRALLTRQSVQEVLNLFK